MQSRIRELTMSTDLSHYKNNNLLKKSKLSLKSIFGQDIQLLGKSIGIFTPENKFRRLCSLIVQHWFFNLTMFSARIFTSKLVKMEFCVVILTNFEKVLLQPFTTTKLVK